MIFANGVSWPVHHPLSPLQSLIDSIYSPNGPECNDISFIILQIVKVIVISYKSNICSILNTSTAFKKCCYSFTKYTDSRNLPFKCLDVINYHKGLSVVSSLYFCFAESFCSFSSSTNEQESDQEGQSMDILLPKQGLDQLFSATCNNHFVIQFWAHFLIWSNSE